MALAEARAAWQRTANRCLVQEDAKRAPKLACCSSTTPVAKQVDSGPTSETAGQDARSLGCLPPCQNSSFTNLSPSSKWWLHLQPNYGYQKNLANEQYKSLEEDMERLGNQKNLGVCPKNEDRSGFIDDITCLEPSLSNPCGGFVTCGKKDFDIKNQEIASTKNFRDPIKLEGKEGFVDVVGSKQIDEFYIDSECSWIESEKSEPWWRTADTEELALLVAQRSLDLENCDLPQPQNTHTKNELCVDTCCFGYDDIYKSSLNWKPGTVTRRNLTVHLPDSLNEESDCKRQWPYKESSSPTHKGMPALRKSENDPSKAQLLEALRHSQTRAREAGEAAKQACAEKDHIVKLVFRQASQLFAYKQWFQLLQLENFYYQLKNSKGQPVTTLFPLMSWTPQKTKKIRKNWQKSSKVKRAKRPRPWHDISKYAVVFALGLGLVGAGLLLGWTVGWMLPTF